ncbi:MAG TPA: hypothetical protein VJ499_02845, partial [Flavisolibacter sp.]|nr:hypothetical protein [Flavisolibacter sp.]
NISFAQQLKYLQATGDNPICKNDDLPDETQLVSVDDDDEDFINRKHLLLSKYVVAFSYIFILLHQEHIITRRPELFGPDLFLNSPRFIVNRVIKI